MLKSKPWTKSSFFPGINGPVWNVEALSDFFTNQSYNCATICDGAVADSAYGDHSVREFLHSRTAPVS